MIYSKKSGAPITYTFKSGLVCWLVDHSTAPRILSLSLSTTTTKSHTKKKENS